MTQEELYKKNYLKMMNATEDAINMLIQAQRECEELYIKYAADEPDEDEDITV